MAQNLQLLFAHWESVIYALINQAHRYDGRIYVIIIIIINIIIIIIIIGITICIVSAINVIITIIFLLLLLRGSPNCWVALRFVYWLNTIWLNAYHIWISNFHIGPKKYVGFKRSIMNWNEEFMENVLYAIWNNHTKWNYKMFILFIWAYSVS